MATTRTYTSKPTARLASAAWEFFEQRYGPVLDLACVRNVDGWAWVASVKERSGGGYGDYCGLRSIPCSHIRRRSL